MYSLIYIPYERVEQIVLMVLLHRQSLNIFETSGYLLFELTRQPFV